jgi:hypothetical protein
VDWEGGAGWDLTMPGGWSARGVCHLLCCEGGRDLEGFTSSTQGTAAGGHCAYGVWCLGRLLEVLVAGRYLELGSGDRAESILRRKCQFREADSRVLDLSGGRRLHALFAGSVGQPGGDGEHVAFSVP